jgi:uncharacterized protein (TIGR03083 family)
MSAPRRDGRRNDQPRTQQLSHQEWMAFATEEYRRLDELLGELSAEQWEAPTDCEGWTVRDIVAHLAGAAAATASLRESLRQQRLGYRTKGDGLLLDAANAVQIRERAGLSTAELRRDLAEAGRRGVRARSRIPAAARAVRLPFPQPLGWSSLGNLNDTVYSRDAWMHRVDICRATGAELRLTADHDARIVAEGAEVWQRATGAGPLELTGPAGGRLVGVGTGPSATYDAVEFMRALAGRGTLDGVGSDVVVF